MHESIRLGRIFGIPVGVNWSVLVIAALIAWTLAASALPEIVPGQSGVAYWVTAVAGALVFFASLLTHELAHALVGRRNGVQIGGITLWLLGGVSKLEGEPSSAGAEFRIAIVGPLTSFGLAVVFFALAAVASGLALPELVVGSLAWLSLINFILAVFNLLPAYPLDGGRVLRALVWQRNADRLAATRVAARVSHVLAWVLIGLGLLEAFSGLVVAGLWLVLIGWFLDNAGRAEATMAAEQGALGSVRADQLMSTPPVTVPASLTVDALVHDYILGHRHSAFPVVDDAGAPTGLVTLEDVRHLTPERRALATVDDIAVPLAKVPVVLGDDLGVTVLERIRATGSRRALVLDGQGRLVGIISNADLVRALDVGTLSGPGVMDSRS
jgi:Zn-dependent protease